MLTQSEKGSELKNPEGKWTHVDSDRYEIILMMGDMTEVMTNGLIKATPHRVPQQNGSVIQLPGFAPLMDII